MNSAVSDVAPDDAGKTATLNRVDQGKAGCGGQEPSISDQEDDALEMIAHITEVLEAA